MTTDPNISRQTDPQNRSNDTDRDSQWTDTIDDWNAVLSGSSGTHDGTPETTGTEPKADAATESGLHSTDRSDSPNATARSLQLADGSEFVRIGPISDPLLKSIAIELPAAWLADTDVQQIVQWVVYLFVRETNPAQTTVSRVDRAIDRTATKTETASKTIRYLCTNSLYHSQPGVSASSFRSDLEAISTRFADTCDN